MRKLSILGVVFSVLSCPAFAQEAVQKVKSVTLPSNSSAATTPANPSAPVLNIQIDRQDKTPFFVFSAVINAKESDTPTTFNLVRQVAYIAARQETSTGEILVPGTIEDGVSGKIENKSEGPDVLHLNMRILPSLTAATKNGVSVLETKDYQVSMVIPEGKSTKTFKLGRDTYKISLDYQSPTAK